MPQRKFRGLASSSVKKADEAGQLIQQIVPNIKKTATLVQEITEACREQATGADQIRKAMEVLDQVTQQNSATSEESAAASEELSAQAMAMEDLVSHFKIYENGYSEQNITQLSHVPVKQIGNSSFIKNGVPALTYTKTTGSEDLDSAFQKL